MRLQTTLAVLGLVVGACGAGPGAADTTTTTVADITTLVVEITTTEATTTTAPASTTSSVVETTTVPATAANLRGDSVDMGPSAGTLLGVIGIRHDDALNLRAAPGANQPIVDRIPPNYDSLIALGETRSLPAFWTKVRYQRTEGWVNMRYLAYLGSVDDITVQLIDSLRERPEAATLTELGQILAEVFASDDPPSDIVNSVKESVGDLGEVTFDVVGLGDDAVRGLRLHVFAEIVGTHWQVRTVEHTILCDPTRGVDEGSCV